MVVNRISYALHRWILYMKKNCFPLAETVLEQDFMRITIITYYLWSAKLQVLFLLKSIQNSNVKIDNIKYIDCGGYGTLAAFSIGKLLYCKFNGNNKVSEVTQQDIAQLPSEYTLNSSIGVYRSVLVNARNTGSLQIDTYGKITLYCPYSYLYGYVIIPIK